MSRRSYTLSHSRIRDARDESRLLRGISLAAAVMFSALVGLQLDRKRFSSFGANNASAALASDSMASLSAPFAHDLDGHFDFMPKVFGRAPAWFVDASELESLRGRGVMEYTLGPSLREDFSLSSIAFETNGISKNKVFALRLTPNRQGTYEIRITDRGLNVLFLSRDAGTVLLYESGARVAVTELSFVAEKNALAILQNGTTLHRIEGVSFDRSKTSFISNCSPTEVTGFRVAGSLNGKDFMEEL